MRYQGWSGEVLWHEVAAEFGWLDGLRLEWIGNTTSGPQDIQAAATGDVDIGGAFNGSIIRLAAAGAPLTAVIAYYGSDALTNVGYYVPDGSPMRGPRDFIDAAVGMNTIGAHQQDVLSIYLQRGGLSEGEIGDVQPVVVPPVSAEQALRSGQLEVSTMDGAISEKAKSRGGIHPVVTDYQLLGSFSAGCYVMHDDFVAANPATVRTLVAGIAKAIRWAQTRPRDEVVDTFANIIRRRGRNEDTETVRYWRSAGVAGRGGLITGRDFDIWLGRLHDQGIVDARRIDTSRIYTNAFNPFRT